MSMADLPWWTTIATAELLDLRRRLLEHLKVQVGAAVKAELEDIVQHTFVVLFRQRESVKADNDGLFRYLKTVSRHVALDRIRGAKRRQEHLKRASAERGGYAARLSVPGISPEVSAEENEKIWEIFCALDDLDRLVLWSHVVDGQSVRAIARELDLNWHCVAGIIDGTLRRVRRQLTS